jgi:2-polyprenyl-3-methyl-5-hydroxy-6-metoxy-1,4-benzoquinol methylase
MSGLAQVVAKRSVDIMVDHELINSEWNRVAWGNYETNVQFLRRVGLDRGALKILEIGCGKGAILDFLRLCGHHVRGIDLDPQAIEECGACHPEIEASVASGDQLPFDDASFDVVISLDVFEHIRDTEQHLREVTRVLKPGGMYLLQTPNKWTNIPFELLRQWKKFHTGPIQSYRTLIQDHCALHSYAALRSRLSRCGYQATFVDMPVVNEYFRTKMRAYLGLLGPVLLALMNPDRFPMRLRTNFYVRATRIHQPVKAGGQRPR